MTADHNYTPYYAPTITASLFRMVDVSPGPGKCGPGVPKPLAPQFLSSSGCLLPECVGHGGCCTAPRPSAGAWISSWSKTVC